MLKNIKNSVINSYIFLGTIITALWVVIHQKFDLEAWSLPLGYSKGDILILHTVLKNYADFTWLSPFHQKVIPYLNSPDGANWSAWPITEEIPFYLFGLLGSVIGVYPAMNLLSLFPYLAAGLTFLYVAKNYKIKLPLALAGAFVFAFCLIISVRGLAHITVGLVWHIPLMILVSDWAYRAKNYNISNKKYILFIFFCFIFGGFNPYFSVMCCMFLFFAFLVHFSRKNYLATKVPLVFIGTIIFSLLLWHFDTFYNYYLFGSNSEFGGRNLASLQVYAMTLPELVFDGHHVRPMSSIGKLLFYDRAMHVTGESWSAYLGIVGIFCLLFLVIHSSIRLFKGNFKAISVHYYHSIWIVLFSITGGINLLLGTVGFTWLRATNRLSVFLLVIALIYTLKYLSRNFSMRIILSISILMASITYIEFISWRIDWRVLTESNFSTEAIKKEINDDRALVELIEEKVPNGKVFQLPVTHFPEFGHSHKMFDYEHLRLGLHSKSLSFSYGQVNGRAPLLYNWQKRLSDLTTTEMVNEIGLMKYDIIVLHKDGYPDRGESLKNVFDDLGHEYIDENEQFVAYKIIKTNLTLNENINTFFTSGWSADEKTHRWTTSDNSKINFLNFTGKTKKIEISFSLSAMVESNLIIKYNGEIIDNIDNIIPGASSETFKYILAAKEGMNNLEILSSEKPIRPKNDGRKLGTMLIGFQVKELLNDNIEAFFTSGWATDEKTHRWTTSDISKINLINFTELPKKVEAKFKLSTLKKSNTKIMYNSETIASFDLIPGEPLEDITLVFIAYEGDNYLEIISSNKPIRASKADDRDLGTMLIDFKYYEKK